MTKFNKLQLNKEVIAELENMKDVNGGMGTGYTEGSHDCVANLIRWTKEVDVPTIGHDDGSYCVSKTDFLCWCGGI